MLARRTRQHRQAVRARREGAAALEFAIVATPFFFLIFAIMELAMLFVVNSVLENATMDASRLVRTGLVEEEGISKDAFKTALCAKMGVLSHDCEARTDIDVRVVPQFRNDPPPEPFANGSLDKNQLQYLPGDPGALVLIRVWYSMPLVTPMLSQAVSRANSGQAVLSVATAFRNEPYSG